jgi:hypothetical protein
MLASTCSMRRSIEPRENDLSRKPQLAQDDKPEFRQDVIAALQRISDVLIIGGRSGEA